MMKLTVVTFGILLAITFVQGVDLPWVNLEFVTGVSRHKAPEQFVSGVDSKNFTNEFIHLTVSAMTRNTESYHRQIYHGIQDVAAKLTDLTEKLTTTPSVNVEDNLKNFNKLMQDVIDEMPVDVTIGPPSLPDLPPMIEPIESDFSNSTAKEILANFPSIMEREIARIRQFMDQLYMAGWIQARNFYTLDQNSLRKAFTGMMVPLLLEKLEKIDARSDTIKRGVSPGVWKDFTRLSGAIRAAKRS